MPTETPPPGHGEFAEGWPVISAAAIGIGLGMSPLPFYTIGVFIGPISAEFGWAPSKVLLAISVYTVAVIFMAPLVGLITDRFGPRRIALCSIPLFGLAMMLQALHTGSFALYLALWSLVAVFGAGTLPITFTKAVNNHFQVHRGKALGITLVSTGIFGALAKFFAAEVTALYGWRAAYVALGGLPIVIALPVALVAFRDTSDITDDSPWLKLKTPVLLVSGIGMSVLAFYVLKFIVPAVQAEGWKLQYVTGVLFLFCIYVPLVMLIRADLTLHPPSPGTSQASGTVSPTTGMTLAETLSGWRFWMLAAAFTVISVSIGAVIPNLEQILVAKGFELKEAVGLAVLTGLAVLGGRVIGGVLIDRYWAPGVAFVFLSAPAIALYLLSATTVSQQAATLAIMMIGFGAGVEYDFLAYLVTRYFGMRSYASIYGALYAFFGVGAGFGPVLLSRLAEAEGAWSRVLIYAAIALVVASLPLLSLGKYRDFTDPQATGTSTSAG